MISKCIVISTRMEEGVNFERNNDEFHKEMYFDALYNELRRFIFLDDHPVEKKKWEAGEVKALEAIEFAQSKLSSICQIQNIKVSPSSSIRVL